MENILLKIFPEAEKKDRTLFVVSLFANSFIRFIKLICFCDFNTQIPQDVKIHLQGEWQEIFDEMWAWFSPERL